MAISTNGTVIARLAGALYNTQMSNATYAEVAALDPATLANTLYARDFSTSTDLAVATTLVTNLGLSTVAGLNNWVAAQLTSAGASKGAKVVELLNGFAQMTADATYGAAATAFNTKIDAALALSQTTGNAGGTFAAAGTVTAGKTFALATTLDTATGTTINDILTGHLIGTAVGTGSTVQVYDSIDLGSGIDTFNLTTTAATVMSAGNLPTLNGVEIFNIYSLSGTSSLVGTLAPSLTTLGLKSYSAASDFTVTAAPASLTTINISNSTQDVNDVTVTYATGATAGTETITLNLTAVNAITDFDVADDALITINGSVAGSTNGFENVVVDATGTNNLESLLSAENSGGATALKSLTVTGSGSLSIATTLDFDTAGLGTIDASTNSGGISVGVGTDNVTFTGGSGNDTLTFATAGDLDANDVISLGSGTDTIVVADTAISTSTTALNAAINATGAEVVQFSAAVTGLDMSRITANKVKTAADADMTITKIESTDTVVVTGANVANRDLTLNASLGYNTLNLEFIAANTVASTTKTISATSQANINIVSTSDSASLTNLSGVLTNSANAIITITGNGNISLGDAAAGDALGAAAVVNASALTGKLTVISAAGASSITGGSAADTITGGAAADTILGGAGADTISTGANATATGDAITPGLGADAVTVAYVDTAATHTLSYTASAAESFATSVATATTSMDTLTTHDVETAGSSTNTITFTTGVLSNQSGSISVTSTAPTIGTTTVAAFGFVVYSADTTPVSPVYFAYQDTDGDGILEAGEFAIKIVGSSDASDLETFSVTSGKLVNLITGA
jgi:hypothetical protein